MTERSAKAAGVDRMMRMGPERFRAATRENEAAHRQYLRAIKNGTYESAGEGLPDMWAERDEEPITLWYYYHS